MKFLLLLLAVFLSACGSTMKVYDHGAIELNRVEKGRPMAPVLLVYQTYFRQHLHQIFFWDEDKNRFNLEIAPNTDTSKGILVSCLPIAATRFPECFFNGTPIGTTFSSEPNSRCFSPKPAGLRN